MTGSAWAAAGGNGKGQGAANGNGQGNSESQGLALAKGHEKHAPAAPQLTPKPAPSPDDVRQEPVQEQSRRDKGQAGDPGAAPGHNHVTICHATGSGRYIVISPSVKGVDNGHLRHHDDFVYSGSCSRGGSPSPDPDPDPEPPAPPTGDHPPDPHGGVAGDVGARPRGNLPFTGVPALPVGLFGVALVAAGWFLARRKPV
jgi:hypothetical protein